MIDILEQAGLAVNVAKEEFVDGKIRLGFAVDKKTGTKLTGIFGKKGGLEKHSYEKLEKENLEAEQGQKIFLFHSAVAEMMPKELTSIDAVPVAEMPRKFDYYAGGHIHIIQKKPVAAFRIQTLGFGKSPTDQIISECPLQGGALVGRDKIEPFRDSVSLMPQIFLKTERKDHNLPSSAPERSSDLTR